MKAGTCWAHLTFINSNLAAISLMFSLNKVVGGVTVGGGGASTVGGVTDGFNSCGYLISGYLGVGINNPLFLLASCKKDKCKW